MQIQSRKYLVLAALLVLASCGGGDNSNGGDVTPDAFSFSPAEFPDASKGQHIHTSAKVSGFEGELTASVTARACSRSTLTTCPRTELSKNGENNFSDTVTLVSGDTLDVFMVINSNAVPLETFEATVTVGDIETGASATIKASVPDKEDPALAVHFPPPFSLSDQAEIRLRGEISDDGEITSLKADGVDAIIDETTGVWTATVSLNAGPNAIEVVATDAAGKVTKETVSVDTTNTSVGSGETLLASGNQQALDVSKDGRTVYYAGGNNVLYKLDVATGERTVFSREPDVGTGPALNTILGITATQDDQLLVADDGQVVNVDAANGNRTVLSGSLAGIGTGAAISPAHVMSTPASDRLYLISDAAGDKVYSVQLPSGNRAIVSDDLTGTGPAIIISRSLVVDETGVVYIGNGGGGASAQVLKVDPSTGDRSNVSAGTGPSLGTGLPAELRYWQDEGSLLVAIFKTGAEGGSIMGVDPATGDRETLSSMTVGKGPALHAVAGMGFHAPRRLAFVSGRDAVGVHRIFAVDLENGDRVIIAAD